MSAGASGVAARNPTLAGQVGFKAPGASGYSTLNAAAADLNFSTLAGQTSRYGGFVNVTSLVQAAGAGTYSVANVQAGTGEDRYAGWTLVVAYHDSSPAAAQPDCVRWFRLDQLREPAGEHPGLRVQDAAVRRRAHNGWVRRLRGRRRTHGRQRLARRNDAERRGQSPEQLLQFGDLKPRCQRDDEDPELRQPARLRREARSPPTASFPTTRPQRRSGSRRAATPTSTR